MKIDIEKIRALAEVLKETELTEIEISEGESHVRVHKESPTVHMAAPAAVAAAPVTAAPAPQAAPSDTAAAASVAVDASHPGAITSPMVGTVYLSPEPGASNFKAEGDAVKEGDTIMIVEAMKVMNPIKADKAGTLTKIAVDNQQPVEFGDVLAIIE